MKHEPVGHGNRQRVRQHERDSYGEGASLDALKALEELGCSLRNLASNLKGHVSECFDDYVEARHVWIDRGTLPSWAHFSFCDTRHIYNLLEFCKGVQYARAFAGRICEVEAEVTLFADSVLSFRGSNRDSGFTEFRQKVEHERQVLERSLMSLARQTDLICGQMTAGQRDKGDAEKERVSLTENEHQLLQDMARHECDCRSRCTISAATEIRESTLRPILKTFEKKGWIDRPKGPRSGYTITVDGMRIFEQVRPR